MEIFLVILGHFICGVLVALIISFFFPDTREHFMQEFGSAETFASAFIIIGYATLIPLVVMIGYHILGFFGKCVGLLITKSRKREIKIQKLNEVK